MKQVININFQGRVVPIEQAAYESLRQYIDTLSRFFSEEDGRDEIINDIESRIGELFEEKLTKGSSCITDEDVNAVIRSIGRPEDIEAEDIGVNIGSSTGSQEQSSTGAGKGKATYTQGKKLYRNENEKVLGGVCSGLAHYFNIDTVVVRIIFVILMFSFGIGFIPYLILWVVVPSTASLQIGSVRRRLFRDEENKYVAGVCSGLGNYFGINAWIPRVLFLLPLLSFIGRWGRFDGFPDLFRIGFSPTAIIIYVILWLVIPEAKTTSEKLEMKGEKVDFNSIKDSVKEELRGVQDRASKFGSEASSFVASRSGEVASDIKAASKRSGSTVGNVISMIFKIIGYSIAGVFLIALLVGLFALAIASIGLFPLKDYVLNSSWQNVWAWGTLLFFIAIPIIGLITYIIRRITKSRGGSKYLTGSFIGLWIIGWVCVVNLAASVTREFKKESTINVEQVYLPNPNVSSLEISSNRPEDEFRRERYFQFSPYSDIDEDTATVRNVRVNIFKATADSFYVSTIRTANGRTREDANENAGKINYNITQQDSTLYVDRGIGINKTDKFRNQHITINVYVPVGKRIKINKSVPSGGGAHIDDIGISADNWDGYNEKAMRRWSRDEWYTMTEDGLVDEAGFPANSDNNGNRRTGINIRENGINIRTEDGKDIIMDEDGIRVTDGNNKDDYRYDKTTTINKKIDSLKKELQEDQRRKKDSIEKSIERSRKELENLDKKPGLPVAMVQFTLPGYNPALFM